MYAGQSAIWRSLYRQSGGDEIDVMKKEISKRPYSALRASP
jgi:hypothetical protein